jgi:cytochrome c oxidase assembly factor CtaG
LALLLFYFGMGSPLNVAGHFLFSAHMLQQSILYLVLPLLMLAAFFMWMPVIAPLPEVHRLSELQKLGYIFANGVCKMTRLRSCESMPNSWASTRMAGQSFVE